MILNYAFLIWTFTFSSMYCRACCCVYILSEAHSWDSRKHLDSLKYKRYNIQLRITWKRGVKEYLKHSTNSRSKYTVIGMVSILSSSRSTWTDGNKRSPYLGSLPTICTTSWSLSIPIAFMTTIIGICKILKLRSQKQSHELSTTPSNFHVIV